MWRGRERSGGAGLQGDKILYLSSYGCFTRSYECLARDGNCGTRTLRGEVTVLVNLAVIYWENNFEVLGGPNSFGL